MTKKYVDQTLSNLDEFYIDPKTKNANKTVTVMDDQNVLVERVLTTDISV